MTKDEAFELLTQRHNIPEELFNLADSIIIAKDFLSEVDVTDIDNWESLLDSKIDWLFEQI